MPVRLRPSRQPSARDRRARLCPLLSSRLSLGARADSSARTCRGPLGTRQLAALPRCSALPGASPRPQPQRRAGSAATQAWRAGSWTRGGPVIILKLAHDATDSRNGDEVMSVQSVIPVLVYRDIEAAHRFLVQAFGFHAGGVDRDADGNVVRGEVRIGDMVVWLHRATDEHGLDSPRSGNAGGGLVVQVPDVDAHFARARARGAWIQCEPRDRSTLRPARLRGPRPRRASGVVERSQFLELAFPDGATRGTPLGRMLSTGRALPSNASESA